MILFTITYLVNVYIWPAICWFGYTLSPHCMALSDPAQGNLRLNVAGSVGFLLVGDVK
jgi:hypothetical protein